MNEVHLHSTMDTVLHADAVEWCPFPEFYNILICGTYQQEANGASRFDDPSLFASDDNEVEASSSRKRVGCLHVIRVTKELQVEVVQTVYTPGVLDVKWARTLINNEPLLGVVTAVGELCVYKLIKDSCCLQLVTSSKLKRNSDKELLGLSLDWSWCPNVFKIVVSDSHGNISVFILNSAELVYKHHWNAHSYEAWITVFDKSCQNIVYSGGDDSLLHMFDFRCGIERPQTTSKIHESGVTALHCNPRKELLATGSYDGSIRIWDLRQLKKPVKSKKLEEAIWKVKWEPNESRDLGVACMYDYFQIVTDSQDIEMVATFKENESLAYGIDYNRFNSQFSVSQSNSNSHVLAMCSFYDHKLYIASMLRKYPEETS